MKRSPLLLFPTPKLDPALLPPDLNCCVQRAWQSWPEIESATWPVPGPALTSCRATAAKRSASSNAKLRNSRCAFEELHVVKGAVQRVARLAKLRYWDKLSDCFQEHSDRCNLCGLCSGRLKLLALSWRNLAENSNKNTIHLLTRQLPNEVFARIKNWNSDSVQVIISIANCIQLDKHQCY